MHAILIFLYANFYTVQFTNGLFIEGTPVERVYTRLYILDFDSTRKRMSVIARDPSGRIIMITKGAESSVIPRYL